VYFSCFMREKLWICAVSNAQPQLCDSNSNLTIFNLYSSWYKTTISQFCTVFLSAWSIGCEQQGKTLELVWFLTQSFNWLSNLYGFNFVAVTFTYNSVLKLLNSYSSRLLATKPSIPLAQPQTFFPNLPKTLPKKSRPSNCRAWTHIIATL
jgi:hypothetical protein